LLPRTCLALQNILKMEEATFRQRVAVDGDVGGKGLVYPEKLHAPKSSESHFRAHRGRLEGMLRESLDVEWGHVLENVSRNGKEYILDFREKDEVQSTLLVDTSGVHSPVRNSLLPGTELNILPYVVFRGTRHVAGSAFKTLYEEKFAGGKVLESRNGDVLLQISINDVRNAGEGVDISYIYSRPAHPDDQLHRPDREQQQAAEISELFFAEASKLGELEQPFKDAFDVQRMRGDRMLHWLMRDILLPLDQLTNLAERGVLLIGDAAHATPILGGDGANHAVGDAIQLAEWISSRGAEELGGFYGEVYAEWEREMKEGEEILAAMHFLSKSSL